MTQRPAYLQTRTRNNREMGPPPFFNTTGLMYEPEFVKDTRRSAMTMSRAGMRPSNTIAGMRTGQNTTGSSMRDALVWDLPERPATTYSGYRGGSCGPHQYMGYGGGDDGGGGGVPLAHQYMTGDGGGVTLGHQYKTQSLPPHSLPQAARTDTLSRSASVGVFPSRKLRLTAKAQQQLDRTFGNAYAASDTLDRSWMKMPAYLVASRKALHATKKQRAQIRAEKLGKTSKTRKTPTLEDLIVSTKEDDANSPPNMVVNDLNASDYKKDFQVTSLHSIGQKQLPSHLKDTEAQRFNLFNFPNTGNIYNVAYMAAAARSAEEQHEHNVKTKQFHKYKRRVTDWC